jgi:predicted GNAT family acetyltransferase
MGWTLTDDIAAYQRAVAPLLEADPVRNTVLLSVLASLASYGSTAFGSEPPLLAWWFPDSDRVRDGQPAPGAAALQTPPYPLLVTALPGQAAAELAQVLADLGTVLPGINGAEQDVTALARGWLLVTGQDGQISQRQRLYRLVELVPPDPAPDGAARVAAATDTANARAYYAAFSAEIGEAAGPLHLVDGRVAAGQLILWETGGELVSLAGATAVLAGVSRIGPVYTPPRWRCRGYGAAVTAAACELARRRGADAVVLFTDLANQTTNSLYSRLGFCPVEDRVVLRFQ